MRSYIFSRLMQGLLVVWVLATIVFVVFRLLPTDPSVMLVDSTMTPEVRKQLLAEFGLDRPIVEQYVIYLKNIVFGNFGVSFYFKQPAVSVVVTATLNTLVIVLPAIVIGSFLGCYLGIYLGWAKRNSFWERVGVSVAAILRGFPHFVIGLFVLVVLSFWTGWFPLGGMRTTGVAPGELTMGYLLFDVMWHAMLPVLTVVLICVPETLLVMRTTMIETRGEDYLDFIKAKGASDRSVMYHAARNSLLPVLTWILISFGNLIAGIVVVETVFSWPGIGRELVLSVSRLDYPVAQCAFLMISVIVTLMNIITDLVYVYVDPRVTALNTHSSN